MTRYHRFRYTDDSGNPQVYPVRWPWIAVTATGVLIILASTIRDVLTAISRY